MISVQNRNELTVKLLGMKPGHRIDVEPMSLIRCFPMLPATRDDGGLTQEERMHKFLKERHAKVLMVCRDPHKVVIEKVDI